MNKKLNTYLGNGDLVLKLIVGLGNPGTGYSDNRHNVGFMCLSHFAREHHIRLDKKRGYARIGEGAVNGLPVLLARPQTYMNASGLAVKALLDKTKTSAGDLIVIHDDLDLPVGRLRIRKGGSSGGHNGIKSIIGSIGTGEFVRFRIGIGRPDTGSNGGLPENHVINYVLGDFNATERQLIQQTIIRVNEALEYLLAFGLVPAMNKYNTAAVSDT